MTFDSESTNPEGELLDVLHAVGFALWQVAECEDTLAHMVVMRVDGWRGMGPEQGHERLGQARSRTFGRLLSRLSRAGCISGETLDALQSLHDERNWLVHRSKRESRGVLNNAERRAELLGRLARLAERANAIHRILAEELQSWVLAQGVSPEAIQRDLEAKVASLRRGTPSF